MSDILKKLNLLLSQGKIIEFNQILNDLKNHNKIDDSLYYKYLGVLHLHNNNLDLAEKNLVKSIDYNENSFDNHLNLAVCYAKQNKNQLSIKHFKKSIKLKNDFLDTYILYSRVLRNIGSDNEAIKILKQGQLNLKQNSIKIYVELAEIYREKREFLQAILNYNFLIKSNPSNHVALNSIAVCYEAIGETSMAETNYLKAIKLKSNYFEALGNFGNLKRSKGENSEALKIFEKCLSLSGPKSKIYRYISVFHKFKSDQDKYLLSMQDYLKNQELVQNDKDKDLDELYFAFSKAYEDLKDVKKFGYYLNLGNEEKRKKISDNTIKKEMEFFNIIQSTFSSKLFHSPNPEINGEKIIIVMGMPRSGTTLVEQILGSHNKVKAGGEQVFFQNILRKHFDFYNDGKFSSDISTKFKKCKNDIALEYLKKLKNIHKSKIVTDKLPFNFFFIGFFLNVFKNIKIIHVNRDPMDNCFSIYKNFFPEQVNFAYDQNELSDYYLKYAKLMKFWKEIYLDQIFDLKYENLILNSEEAIKNLLDFCNLDWDENCLKFYENKNAVSTLSSSQVRNPIYTSSVKSWEKYKDYLSVLKKRLT